MGEAIECVLLRFTSGAIFGMLLGKESLDKHGKKDVGHGMLWAANGCRFRPWEEGSGGQVTFPQPNAVELASLPLRCGVDVDALLVV